MIFDTHYGLRTGKHLIESVNLNIEHIYLKSGVDAFVISFWLSVLGILNHTIEVLNHLTKNIQCCKISSGS